MFLNVTFPAVTSSHAFAVTSILWLFPSITAVLLNVNVDVTFKSFFMFMVAPV